MKKEFGLLFWIHLLLLIPAYISPFLVNWKIILIGVILLQIQYWLVGGCILTHLQMGNDKNETFIWYYLRKIYPRLSAQKVKFTIRVVIPIILIITGFILQTIYNFQPLIQF